MTYLLKVADYMKEVIELNSKLYLVRRLKNGALNLKPVLINKNDFRTPLSEYTLDEIWDEIYKRGKPVEVGESMEYLEEE